MIAPPLPLAASPASILETLLTEGSGALFSDPTSNPTGEWPLFVSALPDGPGVPNDVGCLYDTAGVTLASLLASGFNVGKFGVQLKTRATVSSDSFSIIESARMFLSKINRRQIAVGSTNFTVDTVRQTSPVLSVGQDERRRAMHTLNLYVHLLGY